MTTALTIAERRTAQLAAERARLWRRIQREAPELAEWLTALHAHCGKPARLEVRFARDEEA